MNFGVNYFYTPKDAFYHYAALAYFRRAQQDFLVPSEDDVMQGYLQLISSCKQCDQSTTDLNLFNNHIGQYIEFPLLVAVQQQNVEAINLLLDCGAQKEIDCGNYCGESHTTPFSLCITSGFLRGVEAFLQRGININKVLGIESIVSFAGHSGSFITCGSLPQQNFSHICTCNCRWKRRSYCSSTPTGSTTIVSQVQVQASDPTGHSHQPTRKSFR